MELFSPKSKTFLVFFLKIIFIFQEGTCKARKTNIAYISGNGAL